MQTGYTAPAPEFRVIVCGGRDYTDRERVFAALDRADARRRIDYLIHGGAPGADELAGEWARERGRPHEVMRAEWKRLGAAAGPARNQRMLDECRPSALIAFPGQRGTADMVRRAEAAGLPVWRPYG